MKEPFIGLPIAQPRGVLVSTALMSSESEKIERMLRRMKVEKHSATGVELSTSADDLPVISESVKLLIKPIWDGLPPGRRSLANLQDALDLAKEGWNLHVELGDDKEDLAAELAARSAQFVGRGLAAEVGCQLLEILMARKRELFPSDDRLILKARALAGENGLQVMVTWGRYAMAH